MKYYVDKEKNVLKSTWLIKDIVVLVTVYIGLGSNIGDRLGALTLAQAYLKKFIGHMVLSQVIETKPLLNTDQPYFLNQVVKGTTTLDPVTLLRTLQEIQRILGRRLLLEKNQPRVIDIDLLDYNQWRLKMDHLELPHPGIAKRRFVLEPLEEIDPLWTFHGKTAKELLGKLYD